MAAGCWRAEPEAVPAWAISPADLVPAGGVVRVQGEPLAHAVVVFVNANGIPGIAETDDEGRYRLETVSRKGALPGKYRVSISYVVSPSGKPQGIAARSGMSQSAEDMKSVERLPADYSHPERSKLTAEITREKPNVDFDLTLPLEPAQVAPPAVEDAGSRPAGPGAVSPTPEPPEERKPEEGGAPGPDPKSGG